jgi:hypothetical protein
VGVPRPQEAEVGGPQEDHHLVLGARDVEGVVYPESGEARTGATLLGQGGGGTVVDEALRLEGEEDGPFRGDLVDADRRGKEEAGVEELDLEGGLAPPEGRFRTEPDGAMLVVVHSRQSGGQVVAGGNPGPPGRLPGQLRHPGQEKLGVGGRRGDLGAAPGV